MQVNKDKVYVLPKSAQGIENFVCPCAVCTEKAHIDELRSVNLQEVKDSIEDIIQSTSLFSKDFQIDISYSDENVLKSLKSKKNTELLPEIRLLLESINAVSKLSDTFNKHYRHPLMCELRESIGAISSSLAVYSNTYTGKQIGNTRLWDLQEVIKRADTLLELLDDIIKEELLFDSRLDAKITKVKMARQNTIKELKKLFVKGITTPHIYPHASQNEYVPEYQY